MISICNSQLLLLIIFLFTTTSHAIFFNYPKNVLMDFFETLREKKELKKELPSDIHHYHIHYYPVYMHSPKAIKAPDKSELEILHTNKLEQLGWSNQEYKNVPEPKLHHLLGLDGLTAGLGHRPWWDENTVDRHEESKGIVVQVPLNQQIIVQQPKEEEKVNPLVAFFRKLKSIKNSIFSHHSDKKEEDEEHKDHKISTVFVYTHPSKHGHYP
ncbi:uncharacterized protein LOC123262796 [Cotesia glomerata]|uniref:uncharacterized protein LOC123262796 n=1 Tax=Cotesia glomerata TaxID=32391 RepID=UPI001D02657C|nr:uncharacterized protein LOC123262796 [Cotesia glomerata]XP_044581170.1 uncharacterized protein LOC123262796 [Cotesia glomerata]